MSIVSYDIEERRRNKMRADDRVLILKPIAGKTALSSTGSVDKRLFTGENKLHAVFDNIKGTWSMHYDVGGIPGGLDVQFTEFNTLLEYARNYFKRRNVEITEVKE